MYPLPLVRPDPVSNLQNTTQTTTTISLIWALGFDGRESIDSVTVTYAAVSNNDGASEGSVPLGASATAHTLTGLQPLTNYNISLIATNNVGSSIPESITVETDPVGEWQLLTLPSHFMHFLLCTLCTVPDQPTNVVVTPLSSTQLRVTWMVCVCILLLYSYRSDVFSFQTPMRNTFTQTAFQMSRVEYSTSSDFSSAVQMSTVLASVTTFDTTNNLMKGTIYYFRVSITNSAGFGPVSDTMSARTNVDSKYTSLSLCNNSIKFVQYFQLHKEYPIFGTCIKIYMRIGRWTNMCVRIVAISAWPNSIAVAL